ncbi:hypothetical protein PVAND_000045 [Polypedilum vanderplanki]|uniref:Cytochrome P450 n=1 Tax=Polypedilum vanderplanki TaxID=319348 RepID=A0A9J6BJK2_POLVA|nr:hypothetical protein PVAND_000045 [Polypedilum vanderplanki]
MHLFIFFLLVFFTYIYVWLNKRKNYWKDRGFLHEKFEFPFGSFKGIGSEKSMCIGLDEYYKKYKGKGMAVGLFCFVKPLLLPIDPELIKMICVQNFDAFQDRLIYYNKEDDPISVHLLALEGQKWKERRQKLTFVFSSAKMRLMFDIIQLIGNHFVQSLENAIKKSNQLEMHDWLARFTTDVISNVAFGMDSSSLNNPQADMRKYGKEILNLGPTGFLKFLFTSSFPALSRKLHITANKKNVIDFFYNTFKKNIEQRERTETFRKDFIQILLELKKSSSLTVSELAAESFIFFLGVC